MIKRLAAPLVVALVVMFAVGPVADGLVCGPDDGPSSTQVTAMSSDQERPTKPDFEEHAVCSHGHCHHASLAIPSDGADQIEPLHMADAPQLTAGARRSSAYLSGVERPPRV